MGENCIAVAKKESVLKKWIYLYIYHTAYNILLTHILSVNNVSNLLLTLFKRYVQAFNKFEGM